MNYNQAEILGLQALSHMAAHEEILIAYLSLSGITPDELRSSASDPATLGSILDYFLQNEKRLITFCETENIAPDQLKKARLLLPGGETVPYNT
ncbi:MAG: DUF3572 domain-containing protein [Emcibacter sp.]|nr:DUF3572 domain-containing protein [Emcibacter sp.]